MFYIARGIGRLARRRPPARQFPESYNLIGRKLIEILRYFGIEPAPGSVWSAVASAVSIQSDPAWSSSRIVAGIVLAKTVDRLARCWPPAATAAPPTMPASTPTGCASAAWCSAPCARRCAGIIYIAYYRSFNPSAGQLRELDVIAAVIIGGGSIFGGFGTILGALAGAAVITLIRALLSLQIFLPGGASMVMPQHWVNVFIGLILIVAVLGDIWLRQEGLLQRLFRRLRPRRERTRMTEAAPPPIVEMRRINKSFGAIRALTDVHLRLMPGEILGLVGDNSAGKSTLMKILTGAYQRDAGDILVAGEDVHFREPA